MFRVSKRSRFRNRRAHHLKILMEGKQATTEASAKIISEPSRKLPTYSTEYLVDYCYQHMANWASDARAEVKRLDANDGHMVGRPPSADISRAKANICALAAKLSKVIELKFE